MRKLVFLFLNKSLPNFLLNIYINLCKSRFKINNIFLKRKSQFDKKGKNILKNHGIWQHYDPNIKEIISSKKFKYIFDELKLAKPNPVNPSFYKVEGNKYLYKECSKIITKEISNVIKTYFGSEFQVLNFEILRSEQNKNTARAGSFLWHIDNYNKNSFLKLFCYLNNVKKDNGAFQCIPKHLTNFFIKKGFNHNERSKNPKEIISEMEKNLKVIEGLSGTIFVCNTADVIHRGSLPIKGKREVIVFELAPVLLEKSKFYNEQSNFSSNRYYQLLKQTSSYK